jgi:hypothetical protein
MSEIASKFIVVTLTAKEAKIWATGIEKGSKPEKISASVIKEDHHFKNGPKVHHDTLEDPATLNFFESIAKVISPAAEILLIGHGTGKASAMLHFVQFLERKHPLIAKKVVDALDENLVALTEPEILALTRQWFDHRLK